MMRGISCIHNCKYLWLKSAYSENIEPEISSVEIEPAKFVEMLCQHSSLVKKEFPILGGGCYMCNRTDYENCRLYNDNKKGGIETEIEMD